MKKLYSFILFVFVALSLFAQSPQKMSYQAVIRNSSDQLVTNHVIGMRISILQASSTGLVVYVETQTPTTNANGLISIEIGGGTTVTGTFADIDWSRGPYFIKTEADPTGVTSYSITGTSQLLSVPFAFYSLKAGNGFSGNFMDLIQKPIIDGSETKITEGTNVTITGTGIATDPYVINSTNSGISSHFIGDSYNGGIVFYVTTEGIHGLIAATQDQSVSSSWYEAQNNISNPTNHNVEGKKFTDWRLPTKYELSLLYIQKTVVGNFADDYYWHSSEDLSGDAYPINFNSGLQSHFSKGDFNYIRSIRSF